jgi:hypothetical protein
MAIQKERRAAPRKPAAAAAKPQSSLSNEEVYQLIAETAYFKAKARGFEPGNEVQDWIEAEREIRQRIENRDAR